MNTYADTGFITSLYVRDANSSRAQAAMPTQLLPISVCWLHQLEFRNALRLRVFRKEMTTAQRDASLNFFLADLANGVWVLETPPHQSLMTEAERFSAMHSETIGTRSLDILHVAAAVVLGCSVFLTFDLRQSTLAKAAGLTVPQL
jgi:predicted nucleic acid-binding protein